VVELFFHILSSFELVNKTVELQALTGFPIGAIAAGRAH
jgi:hypothetical protein